MSVLPALAKHISGGEIRYEYMGKNGNKGHYKITLVLYRDINPQTINDPMDPSALIAIYNTGSNTFEDGRLVMLDIPPKILELTRPDPCIKNPPKIKLEIGFYSVEVDLEFTPGGYTISYQRCCRVNDLFNINTSGEYGVTYTTTIPGSSLNINYPINSTPIFKGSDTTVICAKNYFKYDLSATDADGDQLEYRFVQAFTGGGPNPPDRAPMALPPPYSTIPYSFGFSGESPLGSQCSLNPLTGVITGNAPDEGVYLIAVEVLEKRNGIIINRHRKDFHLKVNNCTIAKAELNPTYISCDGFSFTFQNLSNSALIETYTWDFDTSSVIDVKSYDPNPTYVYKKAAEYVVQLITNENQGCSDTAYSTVKTFPGFFSDFKIKQQACVGVPFDFIDLSESKFGKIDKWHWDFGETSLATDISFLQNPFHIFSGKGTYDVSLIVGNDIGCFDDTIIRITVEDKPYLSLRDTIMCTQDGPLHLTAIGTGDFTWIGDEILQKNEGEIIINPTFPSWYYVTLTQAPGCFSKGKAFVDVRSFVSLDAGNDTTICLGDSILLNPISDGVSYTWTPANSIVDPTLKQTWARPTETTRYAVLAKIGKECQANDGFVVTTVPYPAANAGKDTLICFGKQVQLNASGGIEYLWNINATLDDRTLQDPIASPMSFTAYIVGVYDNKGCPKPAYDTVLVSVVPPVKAFAGNDTAVVIGQPLQLNAKGGPLFQWFPTDFLSDAEVSNPIALLNNDIKLTVKVSTPEGCFAYDEMNVKVYKTPPEIFVPTAFTPNGDGLNDNLVPIPVGIVSIEYFKVYNRYGELVFSTSSIGNGWNGVYKGREQGNESFVWQVLGKDYLGKPFYKKGQSTLIR